MATLRRWDYRKSITLSRASGAVTNYQMKILVGESSGSVGEIVDCGGLCSPTFDDIRFTTSDGVTLLDYWIESISGTTPNQLATIWVEFDNIATVATTFYMYYGNSSASPVSSISDTFLFGDDFNEWFPQFVSADSTGGWLTQISDGTVICVYQKPSTGSIVQKTSSDGGFIWSTETIIVPAGTYGWPHTYSIGNTVFLSYSKINGINWDLKFRKSTDGGISWGAEVAVVSTRFADSDIIALDIDTILIASINSTQTGIDIYKSINGGSSWSIYSTPLSGASNKQEDVIIKKLNNENFIIQWEEEVADLGKSYIKSKISTDNCATWGSVITIWNAENGAYDYEVSGFFYDNNGDLISGSYTNTDSVLTSCKYENYKLKYKKSTDHGFTWGSSADLVPDTRGLGPEGNFLKLADNHIIWAHTAFWLGTIQTGYVSRIYHDLTCTDIATASTKWNTGNGKMFIHKEEATQMAKVEGYVTGSVTYRGHILSNYTGSNYAIRAKLKGTYAAFRCDFRYTNVDNHYLYNVTSAGSLVYKDVSGNYTLINNVAFTPLADTWYTVDVLLAGTSIKTYINEILENNFTDSTYSSGYAGLGAGGNISTDNGVYFDWFLVRQYLTTEPTWGLWGLAERNSLIGWNITSNTNNVFACTETGVVVYDISNVENIINNVIVSDVTSLWANDNYLFFGTETSGVYKVDLTTISGVLVKEIFKQYPYITDNEVRYLHGSDNYLCITTISGIDRYNIVTDDRIYILITDAMKCFQINTGDYYYNTVFNLHAEYNNGSSFTYTPVEGNVLQSYNTYNILNDYTINDIYITKGTSSYSNDNTIFLATNHGVIVIEEKRGDEENARRRYYLKQT